MNLINRIEHWGDAHHPAFLDIVRVALGLFIFLKGIVLTGNNTYLETLILNSNSVNISTPFLLMIIYYATFAQMVGGVLIMIGRWTRRAAIILIPILCGAVIIIRAYHAPFDFELLYAFITLLLLIVFMIIGSGPLSLDRFMENTDDQ